MEADVTVSFAYLNNRLAEHCAHDQAVNYYTAIKLGQWTVTPNSFGTSTAWTLEFENRPNGTPADADLPAIGIAPIKACLQCETLIRRRNGQELVPLPLMLRICFNSECNVVQGAMGLRGLLVSVNASLATGTYPSVTCSVQSGLNVKTSVNVTRLGPSGHASADTNDPLVLAIELFRTYSATASNSFFHGGAVEQLHDV
ncbi:hypothetical protein J3F83DRAFT_717032 [Trichoderma novae-zelandiae]